MITHDITIGGFIPGDSVIHRLDPRIKLGGLALMLASVFVSTSRQGLAVTAFAVIALAILTRTGYRVWVLGIKRFSWMLVIAGGANLFFGSGGKPLILFGLEMPFSGGALEDSLIFVVQLTEAIALSLVLTFATTPVELTRGVERLARPLKKFSIPVENFSMVLLLAMRFVPILQQELRMTIDAQRSRGVEFGKGKIMTRSRNLVALLVPTLMGVLRRADLLALAMTARGFHPGAPRSEFKPMELSVLDCSAGIITILFFVLCLSIPQ
ncbi:MAG: energy-coupling factor transporter transmembrane component T [Desulfomonile sp.]